MADDLTQIVQRMIDAGESEDNIAKVIRASGTTPPMPSHEPTKAASGPSAVSQAAEFLPTAMATGGAIAMGGLPGAILGGTAGEGYKQLAQHATELPGAIRDVARNLVSQPKATLQGAVQGAKEGVQNAALQGGVQGGAEVGAGLVGKLLTKGGSRLYQSALKPTKAAREEYPTIVQTGLKAAIPVSRGGAEKAAGLVTKSKAAADALVADRQAFLQRLDPNAAMIDPTQAVGGITSAVNEVKQLPVARPQMQVIGDYGRAYLREHPQSISLTDAQAGVRATDRFYNSAYRATMDRGNPVTAGNTAAALGINNETRNLLRARVPGLTEQNAKTSVMHGVQEAVDRRIGGLGNNNVVGMHHAISGVLGGGAAALGGRDKGLETFAIAEALTNPAIASRLAIAAGKAGSSGASAQAIRQALISLMASHPTD